MRISTIKNYKPTVLYLVYGEDIVSSGIIRNQVIPLLKRLSAHYHISLYSIVRPGFSPDAVQIADLKKDLSAFKIDLLIKTEGLSVDDTVNSIIQVCYEMKPALLHCRSYYTALFAALAKRRTGIPYIFDLRGRMPEEQKLARDDKRGLSIPGPADESYLADKKMEAFLLADADASVTQNLDFSNAVRNSTDVKVKRMVEIQNYVDLDKFQFSQQLRTEIRTKYSWNKKPVLVFSGSMSPWCSFENIVSWAAQIHQRLNETQLVFLTYIDASAVISKESSFFQGLFQKYNFPSDNVHFFSLTPSEVPKWLSAMDVGFLSLKQFFYESQHCTQPIKIGEYLGNGLPFIGNDWETVLKDLTLTEPNSGWVIPDGTIASNYFDSIVEFLQTPESERIHSRECVMNVAKRRFSLDIVSEKYNALYKSILYASPKIEPLTDSKQSVVLYAHYSESNDIPAYVKYAIENLRKIYDHVILLSNQRSNGFSDSTYLTNNGIPAYFYLNEGFDFGMWHRFLCNEPLNNVNQLLLVNDSIVHYNDSFAKFDQWSKAQSSTFLGLTINNQPDYNIPLHLQSFYLLFKNDAVKLARKFILESGIHDNMQSVIKHQEIGISQFMIKNGISPCAMYADRVYPNSIQLYKELLDEGCGFIKRKMLCHSYTLAEQQWLLSIGYRDLLEFDYRAYIIKNNLLGLNFNASQLPS